MRKSFVRLTLVLACWPCTLCLSQEVEKLDRAALIAPLVDKSTVAVFHADLAGFDVPQAIDLAADFFSLPRAQRDRIQADAVPLNVVADGLPEGERADIYVVSSMADLATLPMFIVLPPQTAAANPIALELRRASAGLVSEQVAGSLVTGMPRVLERLKKATPVARPEIAAAFDAVSASAMHALLVPAPEALRTIELLVPNLPQPLGGGPVRQVTGGLGWVAIGIDLPPQPIRFRLVIQATSKDAAQALAQQADKMLAAVAAQPEVLAAEPKAAEMAKRLVPEVAEDRLVLELDEAEIGDLQPLVHALAQAAGSLMTPARGKKTDSK